MTVRMAFPTGERRSSVLLVEKTVPRQVRVGEPFTSELRVTNLTDHRLDDVSVYEHLPGSFTVRNGQSGDKKGSLRTAQPRFASYRDGNEPVDSSMKDAQRGEWEIGDLAPNETNVLRLTGSSDTTGSLKSCVTVSYRPALCMAVKVVEPELRIERVAPEVVAICEPIEITYRVRNVGTGMAENVVVRERLADGLTANGSRDVEIEMGAIPAGTTEEVKVTVEAQRPGRYESQAVVHDGAHEEFDSPGSETMVVRPQLVVGLSVADAAFLNNPTVTTVRVANRGGMEARDLVVRQTIASGVEVLEVSDGGKVENGQIVWRLPPLANDDSRTLAARVQPSRQGRISTRVQADAFCAKATEDSEAIDSAVTNVTGVAAVLLELVDNNDPVRVGENESYDIVVTNQGSAADRDLEVVMHLPDNFRFVSASGPARSKVRGNLVSFNLPELAPKASAELSVIARALAPGHNRVELRLTSANHPKAIIETEATRTY